MRLTPVPTAIALLALLLPGSIASAAADETAHGPNFVLLALQVLNLSILLGILIYFTRRPIASFFAGRSRDIESAIGDAQGRLDAAEGRIAELEQRLAGVDGEAARLVDETEAHARAESERALERAERAAERVREETQRVADQEIARARVALQAEAAELATELATEIVRESLTPEDDRRLVSDFVARTGGAS